MESIARHLEVVIGAVGGRRAALVGYSMGARIALATAILRPGRVGRLVLESGSPGLRDESDRRARRERDEALAESIVRDGVPRFVEGWMAQPIFATQQRLPPEVRARERSRRLEASAEGLAGALRALGTGSQPSFWGRLEDARAPVLLITGGDDGKFVSIAREMASRLPDCRSMVVEDVGHTVHLEAPETWLEIVVPFLAGTAPAP